YTSVEDTDKRFMRSHFYGDENPRFKGRMLGQVPMAGWKYFGPDSSDYFIYYELESDSGWNELVQMLDTFNNRPQDIERVLDLDRHLWMLGFDILTVNLDAPVNMPQNFYLYQDASGRFAPIPWDLNECFGAFRDLAGTGQLNLAQMQRLDPFLRSEDPEYPICSKVLSVPRWRRMHVAHLKTMMLEWFVTDRYRDRAYELQDIIDAAVQADPNKFYSYNDFRNNVTRSAGSGPLAIVGLVELMDTRVGWLAARPEFQATAPAIGPVTAVPARPAPGAEVRFTAFITDADSAWLAWRQVPGARFEKAALSESSGAWTASIRAGTGDIHYYVYAENADAGRFAPERAEHESFVLPVAGDVVINELMALNEATVPDQNGEFDDWVELYSNSGSPLSLDGWFLSDDTLEPYKWEFPDTAIPGHGFLVVWCDDDEGQPGLHASFKLAEGGEQVVLSDPDGDGFDRVIFGQQQADISFGRFPNGTGGFRLMNPTFGAENDSGVGIRENGEVRMSSDESGLTAGPNPFRGACRLTWKLPFAAEVEVLVFDAAGRLAAELARGRQGPGEHSATFAAREPVPGGVYFARLAARSGAAAPVVRTVKLVMTR
ncbi:CotH kinase family protein, partial [candidate division WOR-3 bacterium]|nr:CotH kinase family protein [candidate division WOR-3 bacterium]